ncbi:MAG: hypothetical protein JXO51_05170 [Candidatus Aminicenantes bacterium]|nr:hypothetical protein [Candidatus Aminicenantes bacterium]
MEQEIRNYEARLGQGGRDPRAVYLSCTPTSWKKGELPPQSMPSAAEALEQIKDLLVLAYFSGDLNSCSIPLKTFIDGFEKKVLLTCLRLTNGNQKNAAALLNLKPTALFEKMRKHGIRSQRGRLPGED